MCIICKYWSGCFAVWLKLKWMMTGWLGCNTKHFFVFVFHFFANVVIGSKCFKIVCLSFQIVCLAEIILCHILKGYHAHRNSNHLRKKEINCRIHHQLKMLVQCVYRKSKLGNKIFRVNQGRSKHVKSLSVGRGMAICQVAGQSNSCNIDDVKFCANIHYPQSDL